MNYTEKIITPKKNWEHYSSYVLGIDIGGTNTNLGVAGIYRQKIELLFSLHFQTHALPHLLPALETTLEYAQLKGNLSIHTACIGAAGVIHPNKQYVQLTNAPWSLDTTEVRKHTSLTSILLLNDFQVIGYGINLLDNHNKKEIITIQKIPASQQKKHAVKAVIGAGTGLGKSILIYDTHLKAYVPLPSEGGHADITPQSYREQQCCYFIQRLLKKTTPVCYEDTLSGNGLSNLYLYFRNLHQYPPNAMTKEIDAADDKAPLIMNYHTKDDTCKEAVGWFTRFYARCIKNFILDTLPFGGLYIAGGMAIKNRELFTPQSFIDEVHQGDKCKDVLRSIPLYLINSYDVSLYGACFAAMLHQRKKI